MSTPEAQDQNRINLRWLVRLRWGVVIGQLTTVIFARAVLHVHVPMAPLLGLIALQAVSNGAVELWGRRQATISTHLLGLVMALDVVLFTLVLHYSGGAHNPFSFLYLINIALAAVILGSRWTWALLVMSLLGFGTLYLLTGEHAHHNHRIMELHIQGMGAAYAVASFFIVYFIGRVSRALRQRELALRREQERSEAAHRLASLTTLAAGAAHELATPMATIAVVARELELALRGSDPATLEDVALIRREVNRCKSILDRMSSHAGERAGEPFVAVSFGELIEEAVSKCSAPARVQVAMNGLEEARLWGPREALSSSVAAVLNNGLAASEPEGVVTLRANRDPWTVEVADRGLGMTPDVRQRATDPFFSTREAGKGMGLGLYLAKVLLSRLGGTLEIDSQPGRGTTVALRWPQPAERCT